MEKIGQLMESLFSMQEALADLTADMVNEIERLEENGVRESKILDEINNFFTGSRKFKTLQDAKDYFYDLDI
jgi:hypothetical protein